MANPQTTYLDLDAIVPDREIVVKLGGNEHKLQPITLNDFVLNTKLLQSLAADAKLTGVENLERETDAIKSMLSRAFPTMNADVLGSLTMPQLNTLMNFANANNGATQVTEEAAAANPQTAG